MLERLGASRLGQRRSVSCMQVASKVGVNDRPGEVPFKGAKSPEGPAPMPPRVAPTYRIRGHIAELFAQDKGLPEILKDVARLGAQLPMQAVLEAEVTGFLSRDRYLRDAACQDARPGSRNGYWEVTRQDDRWAGAAVQAQAARYYGAFASRLFGAHITRTPRWRRW
jgi:hypothetical protein